jgi:hypothetical protein
MAIAAHETKPVDEHGPLGGEGVDKVGEILAFHDAMVLKTRDGVIAQLERPLFDASKPASKRDVESLRLLFAGGLGF